MSVVAHEMYPNYGFDSHVGYGTKRHNESIQQFGLTPIHRKTFIHNEK